jgi:hydrogenase nickel incorporation protein HypA/HybF
MHELSLADAMVQEIETILKKEGAEKVCSVTVEMGKLSGVEKEPFEFAFPIVAEGTKLEGCKLVIEESPVVIECKDCQAKTKLDIPFAKCSNCDSRNISYISGKEFLIKSLEIE